MTERVTDFEVLDHGPHHLDYFQGCGVSYTRFEDVMTGIGDNPREAYDDALDQLAMLYGDVEGLPTPEEQFPGELPCVDEESEAFWYVSIRFNLAEESTT